MSGGSWVFPAFHGNITEKTLRVINHAEVSDVMRNLCTSDPWFILPWYDSLFASELLLTILRIIGNFPGIFAVDYI
jgi:hypothetical protein